MLSTTHHPPPSTFYIFSFTCTLPLYPRTHNFFQFFSRNKFVKCNFPRCRLTSHLIASTRLSPLPTLFPAFFPSHCFISFPLSGHNIQKVYMLSLYFFFFFYSYVWHQTFCFLVPEDFLCIFLCAYSNSPVTRPLVVFLITFCARVAE